MTEKVTVLMPAYNVEPYISQAIQSILDQTYRNFELLIMDDGSEDDSGDIARSFEDPRIRVFTQPNAGLVSSLNRLLEFSRTELIARADADDLYVTDRLEKQVDYLRRHSNVGVVGSYYDELDERCNYLYTVYFPVTDSECVRQLRCAPSTVHACVMYRKSFIDRVGGYRNMLFAEDYDLWVRLAPITSFGNIPEVLFKRRLRTGSSGLANREKQMESHRKIRTEYWRNLPNESLDSEQWRRVLNETLKNEIDTAGMDNIDRIYNQIYQMRIQEANLAFGAGRDDIGKRCIYELSLLKHRVIWKTIFRICSNIGFTKTWKLIRVVFHGKFRKAKDNSLFEF